MSQREKDLQAFEKRIGARLPVLTGDGGTKVQVSRSTLRRLMREAWEDGHAARSLEESERLTGVIRDGATESGIFDALFGNN